jgi:hypothetical protein
LLAILIVSSIVKQLVVDGKLPRPLDLGFHVVFAVSAIGGLVSARPRFHEYLAVQGIVIICAYIGLLFTHLQ